MPASDARIDSLLAREILDSRGRPTVEVQATSGPHVAFASVPSGASTGTHEAKELRDGDPSRYGGLGVLRAVGHVNGEIAHAVRGLAVLDQAGLDQRLCNLDGTPDKRRLGGNAILGVSLAVARLAAVVRGLPLWRTIAPAMQPRMPVPMVNMISGGLHAGGNLDLQDFLFVPVSARTYSEALRQTVAVYRALGEVLRRHGFEGTLVGDEGGYGPRLHSNEQAIELLLDAMRRAGLPPGGHGIALDVASSHFYQGGRYRLRERGGLDLDASGMVEMLARWVDAYPIVSIEDGLAEDDLDGWRLLTERLGRRLQLVGDDLFVTNPLRLKMGIEGKLANAVLVKLNQIGTLTETLAVVAMARAAGYRAVVSARSGETEDSFLADLAVASGAGQIKVGSVVRSERLAKYNQLLRIEAEPAVAATFAPWH